MAKYTESPNLNEHLTAAVFVFTDDSAQVLLDQITKGESGKQVPELAPMLAERWGPVMKNLASSFELRVVRDLLAPQAKDQGFFFAAVAGNRLGNFDLLYDPRSPEQILAGQLQDRNGRLSYDIWASFASRNFRTGNRVRDKAAVAAKEFKIDASLDNELKLTMTVRMKAKVGSLPVRVLPLEISRAMQISSVSVDGMPAELVFRESARVRAIRAGDNDPFLVVAPQVLAPGTEHEIVFEQAGSVIQKDNNGVYFVAARSNWYPRGSDEFSLFDMTFRYPKRLNLVTAGDIAEDRVEGDWRITRRSTPAPMRLAGFNLGEYEKVTRAADGFTVDVYGNRRLEQALQPKFSDLVVVQPAAPAPRGALIPPPSRMGPIPAPPDPLGRLREVSTDVSAAFQIFFTAVWSTGVEELDGGSHSAAFGQGFPGLVYLSTLSYMEATDRPANLRGSRQLTFFPT